MSVYSNVSSAAERVTEAYLSGITGVWQIDGRPVARATLARMSAELAHRGPDGEQLVTRGDVGLATQHLWITPESLGEVQPLEGPGGVLLVMDGRLDNREDLVTLLGQPAAASDARLALAAFQRWGEDFAGHLNGDFAIGVFDPAARCLVLARDAVGVRPMYFFHRPGFFAFASEIKALLTHPAVPTEADDRGLADVLMISTPGLAEQDRTCFAGIRSVPPGHLVVVSERGLSFASHWDFDLSRPAPPASFEDYAAELRRLFARAVRRRTRSVHPVAVLVSGGLDSSSVFCHARDVAAATAG